MEQRGRKAWYHACAHPGEKLGLLDRRHLLDHVRLDQIPTLISLNPSRDRPQSKPGHLAASSLKRFSEESGRTNHVVLADHARPRRPRDGPATTWHPAIVRPCDLEDVSDLRRSQTRSCSLGLSRPPWRLDLLDGLVITL